MPTNIKVGIATGDAVLKYVDTDTTVGSNGTADSNIPSTTRIMAIHALATAAGSYSIKGQRQITNKTAEGTAIKFQVAANEALIFISETWVLQYTVWLVFLVLPMVAF